MEKGAGSEDAIGLVLDPQGFVTLTWAPGLQIDGELAQRAMVALDVFNGGANRPLLVDMTGTAPLTRDARVQFAKPSSASRIALLGSSEVDRVIANFAVALTRAPIPIRFFTVNADAVVWLCDGDTRA